MFSGDNKRNLIIAIVVSLVILVGFQFFLPSQKPPPPAPTTAITQPATAVPGTEAPATTATVGTPGEAKPSDEIKDRASVLMAGPRVKIDAPRIHGSIALTGARLDDVTLRDHRETLDPNSPEIVLLSPTDTKNPYFAEFGWVPKDQSVAVPDAKTLWSADRDVLTPDAPVTLSWDNGAGLRFARKVAIDADYLFTVTQRVENSRTTPVELLPYGQIRRFGIPTDLVNFYVLHEGPLGMLNGVLSENSYSALLDTQGCAIKEISTGGWLGITDKYWLTALIPDQAAKITAEFGSAAGAQAGTCEPRFRANFLREVMTVQPGASIEVTDRLFAGAKVVGLLNRYEDELGVARFDDAVDFGWLWFLTKPMFYTIDFFYRNVGNFGIAILLLTICVRILLFPLANKAYVAMSKMRKLQPEMLKLKERHKDDKPRFQQELMALYKREKANPISGCFPILVQVPVFFALYKVLLVSLEMRHAPFFWWIQDLSAPDPMTLITGFGYLDWPAPSFLLIGIWPLVYAFTLFLQQKLNPQPLDPMQQKILLALPLIFLFMFAQFPAGLVIYWTWNNVLSIAQQYVIMRRMGVTKAALHKEQAELLALKAELAGGKNGVDKTPLPASKMSTAALAAGATKSGTARKAKPVAAPEPAPAKKKYGLFKRDKGKSWPKPVLEVETRQMRRLRERTKPTKRPS